MSLASISTTITIGNEEIPVEVDFAYYPGDKGVWQYSNGDPGYPPTPPEVEIFVIQDKNGKEYEFDIPKDQIRRIEKECINHCENFKNEI